MARKRLVDDNFVDVLTLTKHKRKTYSKGAAGRKSLDLCRIDTARLRQLNVKQLEKARAALGPIYAIPKKESGYDKFRWLTSLFVSQLLDARKRLTDRRDFEYANKGMIDYRERKGDPMNIDTEIDQERRGRETSINEAAGTERRIWAMQAQAGCKIRDVELVARDLELERRKDEADKLRRESRRPPTPHKRPAKISGLFGRKRR